MRHHSDGVYRFSEDEMFTEEPVENTTAKPLKPKEEDVERHIPPPRPSRWNPKRDADDPRWTGLVSPFLKRDSGEDRDFGDKRRRPDRKTKLPLQTRPDDEEIPPHFPDEDEPWTVERAKAAVGAARRDGWLGDSGVASASQSRPSSSGRTSATEKLYYPRPKPTAKGQREVHDV